jgi:hypothetical protein
VKSTKGRGDFLAFCRNIRTLHLRHVRIAIVLDNFVPHSRPQEHPGRRLGQGQQRRAGLHPHYASWLNRIEAEFNALRYFTLDGTDSESHEAQAF